MIKVAAPLWGSRSSMRRCKPFSGAGVSNEARLARDYASVSAMRLANGPHEVHCRLVFRKLANLPVMRVSVALLRKGGGAPR